MTEKEFEQLGFNTPILCFDGKLGIVIRIPQFSPFAKIGVQVSGEEDIRWIDISNIHVSVSGNLLESSFVVKR